MSRETKLHAFILKKQPFKEGDEIITLFSRQRGKVRALAKSVKLQKSKLQSKLQTLFLTEVTLTQGNLPKIISVGETVVFGKMRDSLEAVKMAFYALELALKFTPDEQKNEALFNLLAEFLHFLNTREDSGILDLGLAKFKIGVLAALGLGLHSAGGSSGQTQKFFSAAKGGFSAHKTADAVLVTPAAHSLFLELEQRAFSGLGRLNESYGLGDLQVLLSGFIEYQLERQVKSEKYLKQKNMV